MKHEIAIIAYYTHIFIPAFLNKLVYYFFSPTIRFCYCESVHITFSYFIETYIFCMEFEKIIGYYTSYKRLSRLMMSRYQTVCHSVWWFMMRITAMFTMVFYSSLLDFLSRSVMPTNVYNGLWLFVKISATVSSGRRPAGGSPNFRPYTSTILLVRVSQNRFYESIRKIFFSFNDSIFFLFFVCQKSLFTL
jgi:hypothetical protein